MKKKALLRNFASFTTFHAPPGSSVNDGINPDSLQYISIDQAVNLVKQCGQDTLMSQIDLKDAFEPRRLGTFRHLLDSEKP